MPKLSKSNDAISILKADHQKVKDLFKQFESVENQDEKQSIAQEAMKELKIHSLIEEEIFYPAVRQAGQENLVVEAEEEHHVAKMLIAELEEMDPSNEHFEAKFMVLAENVRQHIKEEESEMLPQAKKADLDFDELGQKLMARKEQLKTEGIPQVPEEAALAASHGRGGASS